MRIRRINKEEAMWMGYIRKKDKVQLIVEKVKDRCYRLIGFRGLPVDNNELCYGAFSKRDGKRYIEIRLPGYSDKIYEGTIMSKKDIKELTELIRRALRLYDKCIGFIRSEEWDSEVINI